MAVPQQGKPSRHLLDEELGVAGDSAVIDQEAEKQGEASKAQNMAI